VEIWLGTALSLLLVVATVMIHYELLLGVSRLYPRLAIPIRSRILVVIAAVFLGHIIEVCLYAFVFFIMQEHLGLGALKGDTEGTALDFFYFSLTTYATLGFGDLTPTGPLRLVAGIESLSGLVLIGWSASYTYLSMEKSWERHLNA
jgi:hypothetical protein